jgi:hypothetical protein
MATIQIETEWEEYLGEELMLRSMTVNGVSVTNLINPKDSDMVIPGSAKWSEITLYKPIKCLVGNETIEWDNIQIDYRGLGGVFYRETELVCDFTMAMFNNREHGESHFTLDQIQSNRYIDKCIITPNRG